MQQMRQSTSVQRPVPRDGTHLPPALSSLLPSDWPVEAPLARITTCGVLTVEVVQDILPDTSGHLQVTYSSPDAQLLAKRGVSTAFLLLALLVSQPGCFATRDWLSEKLGHLYDESDEEDENLSLDGLKRVDNVVWQLRHLLCPPRLNALPQAKSLRRHLVSFHRATAESGPGYRLASAPLVWVDVEAMGERVKQARALEQFGNDGLAAWQLVYDLAVAGPFLGQEPYSDWATWRRQEVEAYLWESVQVLWRRYLDMEEVGETKALQLLQAYWLQHIPNEDALRPLLELLAKRECFGQAEEYYVHLCTALAQEGKQPDRRTQETMDFLRALQIQRTQAKRAVSSTFQVGIECSTGEVNKSIQSESVRIGENTLFPSPSLSPFTGGVENQTELDFTGSSQFRTKGQSPLSNDTMLVPTSITISSPEQLDSVAWFGKKLAHVLMTVEAYCSCPEACLELETVLGMELNTMPPNSEIAYALSRRQFLITLAALPTAKILAMLQGRHSTGQIEQFLSHCAASLTACWHLMRGSDYALVEEHLSTYLVLLASLARDTSSKYQKLAASLATQGYRLKGILALHRNNARDLNISFQEAVQYAEIAQHPGLLVAALISLAYHKKDPREAEHLYQRALVYGNSVSPLQLSRLYAQLSVAYAQENREREALHYFHEAQNVYPVLPEHDSSFLYAEFSSSSLLLEQGRVHLALSHHQPASHHPQQAWKIFEVSEEGQAHSGSSERIRYEIINYQAETALALRERDLCCDYIEQGARGAEMLRSAKRRKEILATKSQALKVWPHEARVKALKI